MLDKHILITDFGYLIQSSIPISVDSISSIRKILNSDINNCINYDINKNNNGFYAPYTNYYTTFSTTLVTILEKLNLVNTGELIRIEPIYNTPQDPLIYRRYASLQEYINSSNGETRFETYFNPIKDHCELLTSISSVSNILTKYPPLLECTYFDIMAWIQCNSEHSRHWVFRTPLADTDEKRTTLLDIIKSTIMTSPAKDNSLIAFCDNSSAIRGCITPLLTTRTKSTCDDVDFSNGNCNYTYQIGEELVHPCLTAETHNYPTYYHPFQGAATGEGGRIRDSLATGCGSISNASLVGYSINNLQLLRDASNGASDYANKLGEPCIGGFLRWHPSFEKPIMFSAGLGFIKDSHAKEIPIPEPGDYIVKVGPSAMKIGFGGSVMSSVSNSTGDSDMTAIQRGDPYNGNKVARFLEYLALLDKPLIKKIHDQGAGGLGNVVTELLDGWDCSINLADLPRAPGMNPLECWLSEYQEQMVFICLPSSYSQLETLANRYGVSLYKLGVILLSKQGHIHFNMCDSSGCEFNYTFGYNAINHIHQPEYYSQALQTIAATRNCNDNDIGNRGMGLFRDYHSCQRNECQEPLLERSFKFHLTNKIDRCVGGCVVQQSCIGPFDIPLANYSITRATPLSQNGILSAIGENIFIGQSVEKWIDKTICELLSNLAGVPNLVLSKIKLSGNWMLNAKSLECLHILYNGVQHLTTRLKSLNLAIDGGKDSLSMSMDTPTGTITSPPTLVLTSYSLILEHDIEKRVSPILYLSSPTEDRNVQMVSSLFYIDILAVFSKCVDEFLTEWNWLQSQLNNGTIKALHDGSRVMDILEEMAVASGVGLEVIKGNLPGSSQDNSGVCIYEHHYIIIQLANYQTIQHPNEISISNNWHLIATFTNDQSISYKETHEFIPLETIFNDRCSLSLQLDTCTFPYKLYYKPLKYKWPSKPFELFGSSSLLTSLPTKKIVIIQDEGSNSHREMAAAFLQFPNVVCYDITLNELISNDSNIADRARKVLLECDGVVFVGGFAYGDILGSGRATAMIMKTRLGALFDTIFSDEQRFVLGVCNGCQILVEYGLFGNNVMMAHNQSGKFECRWLPVQYKTPYTQTDCQLGIWIAHGEGRFKLEDGWNNELEILGQYCSREYPLNPNGSHMNAIGIKKRNTRHYAIMPHPERSLFKWQCPWIPEKEKNKYGGPYTPWIEFFAHIL